jgi:hypothetical protein
MCIILDKIQYCVKNGLLQRHFERMALAKFVAAARLMTAFQFFDLNKEVHPSTLLRNESAQTLQHA